jgi:hypothetical protein
MYNNNSGWCVAKLERKREREREALVVVMEIYYLVVDL